MPPDYLRQFSRADRLLDKINGANSGGQLTVAGDAVRGDRDHRDMARREIRLQAPRQLPSVDAGELNVHDDQRRIAGLQDLEGAERVDRLFDLEPFGFEHE